MSRATVTATTPQSPGGPDAVEGTTSSNGLQLDLRRLFQIAPPHIALRQSLHCIGEHYGASYLALHGCIDSAAFSEEWRRPGYGVSEGLRERVNEAMFSALGGGAARALRLTTGAEGTAVLVAPMFDEELFACGAAAMIVPSGDRQRIVTLLGAFESAVGFLSLLASNETDLARRTEAAAHDALSPAVTAVSATAAASARLDEDPWRVAWDMVADLQGRHGVDQVALGVVRRDGVSVEVKVVSGLESVRAGNPGIRAIRAAMEEAVDRREITLWPGRDLPSVDEIDEAPDDPRLHRQWSESAGGDPVATIPLTYGERVIGVVGVRHASVERLRRARLAALEVELRTWAGILPLVDRAGRGVVRHAAEAARGQTTRALGTGWRRRTLLAGLLIAVVCFFAFVRVDDTLRAPARLVPASARVVSAPRAAPLASIHAQPGDRVERGDLLARLDMRDDELAAEELRARIAVVDVDIEVAREQGKMAELSAAQARRRALVGELAVVGARLADAELRAPIAGTVLDGDLRERVGDRLAIGERLFEIAADDRIEVEVRVPDERLPMHESLEIASAAFRPYASPTTGVPLGECRIPPAVEVVDRQAVYLVRGEAFAAGDVRLRPGMEGVAELSFGEVSVWTAWSRPVVRWFQRRLMP